MTHRDGDADRDTAGTRDHRVSGRTVLWIAFVLVHVGVLTLGWVMPNQPMGDVYFVYEPWSRQALAGHGIVGIDEAWVYPQLAIVPMLIAQVISLLTASTTAWIGYTLAWGVLVLVCDGLAFWMLVGRGHAAGRRYAAWFWLVFIAALGPVGLYRIDAITVPIAIAGLLWLARRPWLAGVLLTVGAWIKVWPAALVGAAVIAVRRRFAVAGAAAATTVVVLAAIVALGGAAHALGFVTEQTGRGLQLEAPVSSFYLWQAAAGVPGSYVYYDPDILTFQVTGPEVDAVIAVMTPLMAVAVLAVVALGVWRAWRGAGFATLYPPLALALVLALIVFNKVGSPQFQTWLIAPLVLWLVLDRRRARPLAVVALVAAALTQLVYPLLYWPLLHAEPWPVAVLTARNVLLVALFVWSVVRLYLQPSRPKSPIAKETPC